MSLCFLHHSLKVVSVPKNDTSSCSCVLCTLCKIPVCHYYAEMSFINGPSGEDFLYGAVTEI